MTEHRSNDKSGETGVSDYNNDTWLRPKLASLTFTLILVGIGVPVWWRTTTVHRANLPFSQIENLKPFPDHQTLQILSISQNADEGCVAGAESEILSKSAGGFVFKFAHKAFTAGESQLVRTTESLEGLDSKLGKLYPNSVYDAVMFKLPERYFPAGKDVILGRHKTIYQREGFNNNLEILEKLLPAKGSDEEAKKLPPSTEYDVLITLATSDFNYNLDMKSLISNCIQPFLASIKDIAAVKVKTQLIDSGSHFVGGTWDSKYKHYRITEDEAVTLINTLEPKLGSQLSVVPTFHWVFYIPEERQSPMQIYSKRQKEESNTLLSPRWGNGGIQILNPSDSVSIQSLGETIVTQLRTALGFPTKDELELKNVGILSYGTAASHQWEVEFVKRLRTVEFQQSTVKTLQSLCNLLSQISNIVISDNVADDIFHAMEDSVSANEALRAGNLNEALVLSRKAFSAADRAFFHPSLLALLYFPDDQKYAIYIPLFLPVGIPIVLSLRPALLWILQIFRKKEKLE